MEFTNVQLEQQNDRKDSEMYKCRVRTKNDRKKTTMLLFTDELS